MPKSPPKEGPRGLPPPWFRTYGHVRAFDAACPRCGAVASISTATGRKAQTIRGARNAQYADLTATWTCRRCRTQWYVGLLLIARGAGPAARPGDHVPTVAEAAELRQALGWATVAHAHRRDGINRVCTCVFGDPARCPLHADTDETGRRTVVLPRGEAIDHDDE